MSKLGEQVVTDAYFQVRGEIGDCVINHFHVYNNIFEQIKEQLWVAAWEQTYLKTSQQVYFQVYQGGKDE